MRRAQDALVLLAYAGLSLLYFGLDALPEPTRAMVGTGRDPQIFVWSFAWWAYALETGTNPLHSDFVYAPDGINLAWVTTTPALAVAFAPLTYAFGPMLSYNVAALAMPALSAFTAYLLCRYLTGSLPASVVGGYLFGFSAYLVGQQLGHLHLTSVFLLPLVALVVVRFARGELGRRGFASRLGLLFGLQLWISTEVALTMALALVTMLGLALVLVPELRPRRRALVSGVAAGAGIAALVAAPLLAYALVGFHSDSISDPDRFSGDLLNFVVPTQLVALGGATFADTAARFPAFPAEQGAYIGLPTLALVAWFALRKRRSRAALLPVAGLAIAMLLTLGTALHVRGERIATMPWELASRLPLLNNVLPVRFAAYAALAAAVIVALWMRGSPALLAAAGGALAVVSLVPAPWRVDFTTMPERWPFFTEGHYRECIPKHENVAIFPFGFWGNSMLWQAESGFWFRQAGGYLRPKPPDENLDDPAIRRLTFTTEQPSMPELFAMAKAKGVGRILSVEIYVYPDGRQMHRFGALEVRGGILISPACGHPPIGPSSRLLPPRA